MMVIWGRANSTNVRKALWCAGELGLTFERRDAGGAFGVVDTPEYRALNPNGRIPCLQDGTLILWESNVIVRYLARRYGSEPFAPTDPAAWASADKWMDWTTANLAEPFRDVFWNMVRRTPEERDGAALAAGLDACSRLLAIPDAALAEKPFLSGETLGIGDIPLGCIAYAWFSMPIARPDLPHLAAWYARLRARPAYRTAVMTPLT